MLMEQTLHTLKSLRLPGMATALPAPEYPRIAAVSDHILPMKLFPMQMIDVAANMKTIYSTVAREM